MDDSDGPKISRGVAVDVIRTAIAYTVDMQDELREISELLETVRSAVEDDLRPNLRRSADQLRRTREALELALEEIRRTDGD